MYAIGGNPKAALFAGIDTKKITVLIYTISGICAGMAGMVLTSRNSSMQPAVEMVRKWMLLQLLFWVEHPWLEVVVQLLVPYLVHLLLDLSIMVLIC